MTKLGRLARLNPRPHTQAPGRAGRRLRVESLEARVVPSGIAGDPDVVAGTGKIRDQGPPLLKAPDMPAFATLDVAIVGAIRRAWEVPAGTTTNHWLIQLPPGQSPVVLAQIGAVAAQTVPFWDNSYDVTFATQQDVAAFPAVLSGVTTAEFYYPLVARMLDKKFVPDDPLFPQQWHLQNTGQGGGVAGNDANLVPAWDVLDSTNQPVRGNGVTIGIVDDGLQLTHPDLAPNYDAADSWDFDFNDPDPSPDVPNGDWHGTSVAGVAGARGDNSEGVSGAAPRASLAGLRLLGANVNFTDTEEGAALSYHPNTVDIYSNSWGPADIGTLGSIGPQALSAIANGYTTGRNGKGNIYTWAAGNGLQNHDNVNYDPYANSRYVIAVGAITDAGTQAYYSEPGAPMLVTAYSSGGMTDIVTTDVSGADGYGGEADLNYTNGFGGTSSATPLVSGIVALMLDANPNLTVRDVQNILVRTARKNNPADLGWTNNAAGFHINDKYGFGAIDALPAVNMAKTWTPVAPEISATVGPVNVNANIPDNNATGVTSTVVVPASQNVQIEHVEVVFNAQHTYRGDLRVVLTSPSGTQSVLADQRLEDSDDNYTGWVFSTVRDWGETSQGQWTIKVSDLFSADVGVFQDWSLRFYGVPAAVPPALSGIEGSTLSYVAGSGQVPVTTTLAVADTDSANLTGATVAISGNYVASQDFLRFSPQNGITGTFNAGVLTLTGTATVAQYQAALRSVAYENTSGSPSTATRTVSFRVTDPTNLNSNTLSRNIGVSLINQAPTLNPITDPPAVNEDPGLQTINLSGISAGPGENQTLTITATSSNPAVIPDPTVNYTNPNATGSLTYTPIANQSGTAVITVKVKDTGGTVNGGIDEVTQTFTVVVNSSNDAPTFTKGANQIIPFGAGAQTVPTWATNISAGPPNESSQVLNFVVNNDNNTLFAVQPDIDTSGTLTYTPAPGAFGTATVSVALHDDGGTANGGQDTSPTQTFTIEVDVNDAPVVDANIVTQLAIIPKFRTDPPGDPVTLVGAAISDADAWQPKGIAVVGLSGTEGGVWQFSLDGGATWQPFGTVSPAAARLIRDQDFVRFVPTGTFVGSPVLTYHAWDQSTNAAGDVVDLTAPGATGAQASFSVGTGTARVRVAPTLTPVVEDSPKNKGDKVAGLLTGLVADTDAKAKVGLAITGLSAPMAGVWQYSTTGGKTWKPVPAVSSASALLIGDKDKVRFLPAAEQSGEASFSYRAWDQTTGIHGTTADLSAAGTTGGGTAFSAQLDQFFVQVLSANDRPVVDKGFKPLLTPVAPGDTNPPGNTIAALLGSSVTDADPGDPRGIAIVGAKSTTGRWEYRLNGTGPWNPVGAVTLKTALPLRATDEVRFVPSPGFTGTAGFTYRAWDQTTGAAGTPVDASKAMAFSSVTQTALVTVTASPPAANNAPHLNTAASPALGLVGEDTKSAGDAVSFLISGAFSDPDAGFKSGIAVVGLTGTADGQWQYSTNGGGKWSAMTSIADAHALLLRDTDLVRFVPNKDFVGTRAITYRAWDQTRGSGGQYADLTAAGSVGGTGAVGPETDSATVTVTPANDAPVLTTTRLALFTPQAAGDPDPPGDTVASLLGTSVTDVDAGDPQGIAITKVDAHNGTWMYKLSGQPDWQFIPPTLSPAGALVLRAQDRVRFLAEPTFTGTRTMTFKAWDQSMWTAGGLFPTSVGNAFSKASRTAQVTITPGNDRPILDPKAVHNPTSVAPDATDPSGDTVAALLGNSVIDPDGTDPQGLALTSADGKNGHWQFSTDGGTTWQDVGVVSKKAALLLRAQDRLRFVPNAGYRGSAKLGYVAWDQSSGTAGAKVSTAAAGVTAFSLKAAASIVKVNAAPTLDL
jgi:subtilisin-like proprotein convertase family protein